MWGIAHSQWIRLPTKDYWEFRDMITVSKRTQSFDGYRTNSNNRMLEQFAEIERKTGLVIGNLTQTAVILIKSTGGGGDAAYREFVAAGTPPAR